MDYCAGPSRVYREHRSWLGAAVRRRDMREHPEEQARYSEIEPCLAVAPAGSPELPLCWKERGHSGPHSWQRPAALLAASSGGSVH